MARMVESITGKIKMFNDLIDEKKIKKYDQWDELQRVEKTLEYLKSEWIERDDLPSDPELFIKELEKCIHFIKTSEVV